MKNLLFYMEHEPDKINEKQRNILIKGLKKEKMMELGEKFEKMQKNE